MRVPSTVTADMSAARASGVERASAVSWSAHCTLWLAAAAIGALTSIGVWLFLQGFTLINRLTLGTFGALPPPVGWLATALIPALGGLLVAVGMHTLSRPARLAAMAHVIDRVASGGGRLDLRNAAAFVVSSLIGIGFGAPVGADTARGAHRRALRLVARTTTSLARGLRPRSGCRWSRSWHCGHIFRAALGGVLRPRGGAGWNRRTGLRDSNADCGRRLDARDWLAWRPAGTLRHAGWRRNLGTDAARLCGRGDPGRRRRDRLCQLAADHPSGLDTHEVAVLGQACARGPAGRRGRHLVTRRLRDGFEPDEDGFCPEQPCLWSSSSSWLLPSWS